MAGFVPAMTKGPGGAGRPMPGWTPISAAIDFSARLIGGSGLVPAGAARALPS
jgi:hypothetical protein